MPIRTPRTAEQFTQRDREKIDPSTRYRCYATAGFVLYSNHDYVLLDRQVIEFCNPIERRFKHDISYSRAQVVLGDITNRFCTSVQVVIDPTFEVDAGKKCEPHPESYLSTTYPDGICGFTGAQLNSTPVSWDLAEFLFKNGEWTEPKFGVNDDVNLILPQFYVKVSAELLAGGNSLDDFVTENSLYEMFDLVTNSWGWFKALEIGPFVACLPVTIEGDIIEQMEMSLRRHYGFVGTIYIGSATLAPKDLQVRTNRFPRSHPFASVVTHTKPYGQIDLLVNSEEFQGDKKVTVQSFFIPRSTDGKRRKGYLEDVLNGPAKRRISRLSNMGDGDMAGIRRLVAGLPGCP